ncbi:Uncharacterised protein [Mobiluncus holmesii]|nr:hypothetical protein [Mobiluncus holmesii]STY98426.1 Uncharacterised protein [Mobiluncus holmesii]
MTETRDAAAKSQEEMIELMAKAMAEVAATGTTTTPLPFLGGFGGGASSTGGASGTEVSGSAPAGSGTPFRYELEKIAQCTDCKTCYQEIPEYFEASTEIIDGKSTPGGAADSRSLENVKVTDELRARIGESRREL